MIQTLWQGTIKPAFLVTLAALSMMGCKSQYKCQQYDLTVCGNNPVQVTACTGQNNYSAPLVTVITDPPDYLDVAPVNQNAVGFFPPGVPIDPSMLTNPTGTPIDIKNPPNVPDAYGSNAPSYDGVGFIKSEFGIATGVLIHPRVVLTSAHGLLPKWDPKKYKNGWGVDLAKEVYEFNVNIAGGGTCNITHTQCPIWAGGIQKFQGWAVIHPAYNPETYAFDIALVVLNSSVPDIWHVPTTSLPTDSPLIDQQCTCLRNPQQVVVSGWGESGNPGDAPPNLLQNSSSYSFPIAAGTAEKIALAQIEGMNSAVPIVTNDPEHSKPAFPPSIELITQSLFEGDKGAPVFLGSSKYTAGLQMVAILSHASSVNSRRATVLTPSIVNWIEGSMLHTTAPYPPLGWNGHGNELKNSSYAFNNSEGWDPQANAHRPRNAAQAQGFGGLEDEMEWESCQPAPPPLQDLSPSDFNKIIVIGDSLSDQTNQWNLKKTGYTPNPKAGYWNGRFTNGYNWLDYLTRDNLDKGKVMNMAVGGAFMSQTAKDVALHNAIPLLTQWLVDGARPTIADEIKKLSGGDINGSLIIVWAGGNDVNDASLDCPIGGVTVSKPDEPTASDLAVAMLDSLRAASYDLIDQGAKRVIFANVPPTYLTPTGLDTSLPTAGGYNPDALDYAKTVVGKVNNDMAGWAAAMYEAGYPGFTPEVMDVQAFLEGWNGGNPKSLNMYQNQYACRNQDIVGNPTGKGLPLPSYTPQPYKDEPCEGYLFFDTLHPTTLAHCGVSQLMEQTLTKNKVTLAVKGDAPFEDFCPKQQQTDAFRTGGRNYPARAVRFYSQAPGAFPDYSFGMTCARFGNVCPNGYYWDSNGTDFQGTPVEKFDPGWFNIASVPGGTPTAGPGNGPLAAGWVQQPSGGIGACRCAPIHDPALDTACAGTCSTPQDVANLVSGSGCHVAAFWSGQDDKGNGVMDFAGHFAPQVGASTLEAFSASSSNPLNMPQFGGSRAGRTLWHWASYVWAATACPNAADPRDTTKEPYVFLGSSLRNNTVWRTTECWGLKEKGINSANYYMVSDVNASGGKFTNCALDCTNAPSGFDASCAPPVKPAPEPPVDLFQDIGQDLQADGVIDAPPDGMWVDDGAALVQ